MSEGNGITQSVNVLLPPEGMKSLFNMLLGAILFSGLGCIIAVTALVYVLVSVREMDARVAEYKAEARLAEYDDQELRDVLIQHGIPVPPNPFAKGKSQ